MALEACRECGEKVSTEAETCPHCGVPDPTYQRKEETAGESSGCFKIFLYFIPFVLGYGVLAQLCYGGDPASDSTSDNTAECVAEIGEVAHISVDNSDHAYLGRTQQAYNELMDALASEDRLGFKQLVQSDRVIRISDGTSVRILDYGGTLGNTVKIRVKEGAYRGDAGWVSDASLGC